MKSRVGQIWKFYDDIILVLDNERQVHNLEFYSTRIYVSLLNGETDFCYESINSAGSWENIKTFTRIC